MLSFKQHIQEVAEPKAGDEKRFKDKHVVAVTDYPGSDDDSDTQNMTKKSPAKKKRLADMDQAEAEKVYEENMMKCEDCGEEYDADEGEHECEMDEEKMTDDEMKKREEIVKGMKDKEADLKKRYGDRWKAVMYATATKKAMDETFQIDEISKELAQKVFKARVDQAHKQDDDERRNKEIASKSAEAQRKRSNREMGTNTRKRDRLDQLDKRAKDAKIRASNASYHSSQAYKKVAKTGDYIAKKHGEKSIPDTAADKHRDYRAKGGKLAFDKWKAQYGERKEEFQIDEAFKVGAMKLKDGSSVKLAKEDVQALDTLYKNLNSSNRKKMQEKLEANKKSFGEILAFAKQAM
jgi:hypothetical protein